MSGMIPATTSQLRGLVPGERFKIMGVLQQIKSRSDKNNKPFWEVVLVDSEGSVEAKVWSDGKWWDARVGDRLPMEPSSREMSGAFLNVPVGAIGTVSEFRGRQQFQFSELFLLDPEKYPIGEFIRSSPVPVEEMEDEFRSMIDSCRPEVRGFLEKVFQGRHGRSSGRCQLPSLIIMPMSMDFSSTHWPSQGAPGLSPGHTTVLVSTSTLTW